MLQMFNNTILNPRIVLKIKLCKKQADKNIFHLDPFWMNLWKLPPKRLWEHSVVVWTKLFMLLAQLFSLYLSDIHVIFLSIKHIFQILRKIYFFCVKRVFSIKVFRKRIIRRALADRLFIPFLKSLWFDRYI